VIRQLSKERGKIKASKTHRKSKGEFEYWRPEGYYATVPNALHALVNQKVRDTHLKDLVTVTKQIEEIHSLIKTAIPV